ncbi:M56 family metallopeptidase [Planctomyces sp. SH-PL62]|uniref:M56 family metallopeptidase n=1 Tax=Planctomyces sp. SH-PL62 TaxID=1636152 RepID=UPI00078BCE43|nr:M56 family metallopeptidase [Planctomyces sp. SH-PL62]AMV38166.1 Methicillin resistance mecR1 protein [Planctomyces sp. SH-PL62]
MTPLVASPSPAWTALGWTFLHMLWVGAVVGLGASLARRVLRRASAEIRHAAALASLVVLAVGPFAAFTVVYTPSPPTPAPRPTAAPTPAFAIDANSRVAYESAPSRIRPGASLESKRRFRFLDPWIGILPGVWLGGSALTLAWLAAGLVGVERLRRSGLPLESGPVAERCRALARSLGIAREVGVAVCDRIAAPVLIGIVRPLILLPTAALTGWAPDQVEMALLHELAHLRRRDNLVSLFQKIMEALLFFHPTTWWLSAWVRLERETCCDRLVVARTGRPRAYAELLAVLASARPAPAAALSLAERPITTRIRRILLMEDRPMTMKPTAPEAFALCAATLLAAALALPTRAEPPAARPKADARADLKRLAEAVAALPAPPNPQGPDERSKALMDIARKQVDQGDRAGALKAIEYVRIAAPIGKDLWRDDLASMDAAGLLQIAAIRYDAGDVETGRAQFRQVVDLVCKPDPAQDAAMMRLVTRALGLLVQDEGHGADGTPVVVSVQVQGGDAEKADATEGPIAIPVKLEVLDHLSRILAERREIEPLRQVAAYTTGLAEPLRNPLLSSFLCGGLGGRLVLAGDVAGGRTLIAKVRKLIEETPDRELKEEAVLLLATSLGESDPEAALELFAAVPPARRNVALRKILENLCTFEAADWLDSGGIKITIGDPGLAPKDGVRARAALSKFAAVAATIEGDAARARTLAVLAHLQARASDLAGALATAEAIPDLRRDGRPEPNDGFHDSIKPATFALIGWRRAQAGDEAGAAAAFARSKDLARAVTHDAERLIAWIVLAGKLEATGRPDEAAEVLSEAVPQALAQPEPRRSRMLAMLAEIQLGAVGVAESSKIVDAIRDEPGLEKARALNAVARRLHEDGDAEAARALARRALAHLQPRASDPRLIPGDRLSSTRDGFIDYDLETPMTWVALHRSSMRPALRTLAGEPDADLAAPVPMPQGDHSAKVGAAFRRGGLDEALKAAEAIESPAEKAAALWSLAYTVAIDAERK